MRKSCYMVLVIMCIAGAAWGQPAKTSQAPAPPAAVSGSAQAPKPAKAVIITIEGDVDYGLQKAVERRIAEAKAVKATLIIFEMDTWGGGLDPAIEIADMINDLGSREGQPPKTVAYVVKKAISAGALISLACNEIVMRDGTIIGDCQPIMIDPRTQTIEEAPEKIKTTVRAKMRSYAQSNGYPELVCEAMVDQSYEVYKVTYPDGKIQYMRQREIAELPQLIRDDITKALVVAEDELLTMTNNKAVKWDISSATVTGEDEVLQRYAAPDVVVTRLETNWSEELTRFLTSPAVAGVLMMVGLLALYMAFKIPGFGVPEIVAISCFTIVFLSKYLVGLANVFEVALFGIGIILLAIEIFVTPGFGVMGISGIGCVIVSLILASQKFIIPEEPYQLDILLKNLITVLGALAGSVLIFMIVLRFLPKTPVLRRLILQTTQTPEAGYVVGSAEQRDLVGCKGVTLSTLRPTGRAEIDGQVLIVVADGEFIENGTPVVVTEVRGNRVVVNKA